jgi:ABC-type glycerol-3-phosphate transport system substrate-binding protein
MANHETPIFWTAGSLYDPETHEPLWTENETVRQYFTLFEQNYSIPGNPYIGEHWEEDGWVHLFEEEQNLAMVAQFFHTPNEDVDVNWDIATYPEPEHGVPARGWAMGISATSEHKEEVMRVMQFWYSDEHMLHESFTRGPLYVPYAHLHEDGSVQEKVMETEAHIWEDRNVEALLSLPIADAPEKISKYERPHIINDALKEFVTEAETDLNTFLREKYDEELVRIEEEKAME